MRRRGASSPESRRRAPAGAAARCGTAGPRCGSACRPGKRRTRMWRDRKSTRLNSSHGYISYAVFCLKKKKNRKTSTVLDLSPQVSSDILVVAGHLVLLYVKVPTE